MKISRRLKINKEIYAYKVEIQVLQSHLTVNFNLIPYEEKQLIYERVEDLENRIKHLKQLKEDTVA